MSREYRQGLIAVALVTVFMGLLASWVWSDSISTRHREERDDLELFLDASSAGWAEVTNQFFTVPEVAAQTVGALVEQMETPEDKLALLAETVRLQPNLDGAYIGYPDGSFFFVARSDEIAPGGFRTRVITVDEGLRDVQLTWTDESLTAVNRESDPTDDYDPRARPWYEPAATGQLRYWTPPYLFASSQQPGITHSVAVQGTDGELVAVVGIDIRLSEVDSFLDELSPGVNGTAVVVDDAGQIIAESSMDVGDVVAQGPGGALTLAESPELLRLVEQLRSSTEETIRERSSGGLHTTIVRRAGASERWYVAVAALDGDFLDDETALNAFEIFAVGVTVAAAFGALGLAILRYLRGLKRDAEIDELTGINNRRAIKRHLTTMLQRSKQPIHVAIIDLDNFKVINDEHGHQVGDEVLITVASRLRQFASLSDATAGRLGGDEFVIIADDGPLDWAWLNQRLAEPVVVADLKLVVTASIGAAISSEVAEGDVEDLFGAADHLLFEAKRQGGDGYRVAESAARS